MTKIQTVHRILQYISLQLMVHTHCSSAVPVPSQQRLSTVEWAGYNDFEPNGFGTYAFGYDIEDPVADNVQFRDEERYQNGTVVGSYGYVRPDGNVHIVRYTADENGYRATVEDPLGQPRFYGNPNLQSLLEKNPAISRTALQSQNVYKKQRIHEQRLRPIDSVTENSRFESFPHKVNIQGVQKDDHLRQQYYFNPQKYYIRY